MTRTVRFRVTALATAAVLVVLAVAGVALVVSQRRVLTESLEETLGGEVDAIVEMVRTGDRGDGPRDELVPQGDDDTVAQVVTVDGTVVMASARLVDEPPLAPPPGGPRTTLRTIDGVAGDDTDYRLASRQVTGPDGTVLVVHVASPLDDIAESSAALAAGLVVALPAVAAVLAAVVWWLVGRTLRPVEAIRVEVADIGGRQLDRRVPEPGTGDEIDRLARTMNAMLSRVEEAARRQEQFVADASHELRTPLTRMRTELEVDRAHPAGADLAATHASLLEEVDGLQHLVDELLVLARAGGGAAGDDLVDLGDLVRDEAERVAAVDGIRVDSSSIGRGAGRVRGDPAELRRALRNLTTNAARHARSTVTVGVTAPPGSGAVVVTVADDGPGIPPDDRERVFERFTRLDAARTDGTGGAGLGLAITRDIVERHGGTVVAAEPGPEGGARLVVTLPAAAVPQHAAPEDTTPPDGPAATL